MSKRRKSSPHDNIITLKLNFVNYCGSGKSSWKFPGSKNPKNQFKESMWRGAMQARQDPALPDAEKDSSSSNRGNIIKECSLLIQDVTQQNQQLTEWEHRMHSFWIHYTSCLHIVNVSYTNDNYCISSKRINHVVLYYMHWSYVTTRMISCRVSNNFTL